MKSGGELTPKEAAKLLRVSLRTVYRLAEEGILPSWMEEKTIHIMVVGSNTVGEVVKQLPEGVVKPRQVRKLLLELERSKK